MFIQCAVDICSVCRAKVDGGTNVYSLNVLVKSAMVYIYIYSWKG